MAKDVITRFKLETTGFDSKIKQAAKDLSAYSKTATQAKEGFNQFTKANIDAAKALGTMATSTTNVKDRVKELVGAYNAAAKAYEELSDEHKKSDFAKALAGSLTQLQQRIKETKQEMQGLGDSMKGGGGGIFSGLGSKMSGALAVFGGNMMTAAAGAVANLGAEMADMVKQGIEMARAGEGVRIAFERLGRGDILDGLREATHGTVTDLELMKAAVKFNDFKLPVEELGTMLAFAQQKAKDTGQSVDYMVDSIVTGLGRKSLMILDNLGLSAAEIKDKMAETGDMTKAVGAIIREQMSKAGDYVETAADRAAQANVSLQNKMEELGRKFAPVEEASNQLWTSMKIGILDIIGGPLATLLNQLTEAGRLKNMLKDMNGEPGSGNTKVDQQLKKLNVIKKAGGSDYIFNSTLSGMIEDYNRQIMALDAKIKDTKKLSPDQQASKFVRDEVQKMSEQMKALGMMRDQLAAGAKELSKPVDVKIDTKGAEQNVESLKVKLIELQAQRKKAIAAGDTDLSKNLAKQINQVKADIRGLDPNALKTTNTTKKDLDELQKIQKKIADLTKEAYTADGERLNTIQKEIEGLQEQESKLLKIKDLVTGKGPDLDKLFPDNSAKNYNTGYQGSAQAKVDSATVDMAMGPLNIDSVNAYIATMKSALKEADFGSDLYTSLTEKIKDATTMSTLLQEMMERGLAGADLESTAQALKEKLLSPEGIDQTAIQSFLEELNKQIEEAGGIGLKMNADTGEVTDDKKKGKGDGEELKKFNEGVGKLTGGLSQVTGGLKAVGVEIPKEVDQVIGVISGVSQIISGVGTIISIFSTSAITANTIALGALTSAVWASVVSNAIPFFSGGGVVPAFAQGGTIPKFAGGGLIGRAAAGMMIPGNSMSGDRLRMPVDGGRGVIGVNSGELILNRSSTNTLAASLLQAESLVDSISDDRVSLGNAQQMSMASEMEGGAAAAENIQPFINGEQIFLGLQAYMRRSGLGEIVTSER